MTFLISDNGEFGKSLKFEARGSAHRLSHGPIFGSAGYLALRLDPNTRDTNVYLQASTDGTNWYNQQHNINLAISEIQGITFVNGLYVVFGLQNISGNRYIRINTSADGITWTSYTSAAVGMTTISVLTYNNNLWQIFGNAGSFVYSYTSTNLTAWTQRINYRPGDGTTYSWLSARVTDVVTSGTTTVVTAYFSSFSDTNGSYLGDEAFYFISTNGTTWSQGSLVGGVSGLSPDGWAPNGITKSPSLYVVVGTYGNIFTSTNGTTWTSRTSGTSQTLYSITYADGKYIAYGDGIILSSTNATSWTTITLPVIASDDILYYSNGASIKTKPVYENSKWIVSDYTSTDAATWTILDYQLPNKQPFIKYDYESGWNTWKTMDLWVYIESNPLIFTQYGLASKRGNTGLTTWSFYLENQTNGSLTLRVAYDGALRYSFTITNSFTYTDWNHLRVVSDGNVGAVYLNGTRIGTMSTQATWGSGEDTLNIGYSTWVGENQRARPVAYFLDEVMLTQELLNSPSDTSITVLTQPFVNNEYTSILLHYDVNFEDDSNYPIRNTSASLASEFTQVVSVDKLSTGIANLNSSSSLTSSITKTTGITANLSANFSLSSAALDLDLAEIALASEFSLTADVGLIKQASSTQQSSTSVTTDISRTRSVSASLEAFDTVVIAIGRTQQFGAYIEASTALSTAPVKTVSIDSSLQSANTLSVVVNKTVQLASDFVVNSTLAVSFDKVITFTSTESTASSMSIAAVKTTRSLVSLSSNATMTAAISTGRLLDGSLFSNCSVSCLATVTRTVTSNQVATATLLAVTNNVIRATANLQVTAFELVIGKTINLANSEIWVVPADNTTWKIGKDTNIWTIPSEDRTYII